MKTLLLLLFFILLGATAEATAEATAQAKAATKSGSPAPKVPLLVQPALPGVDLSGLPETRSARRQAVVQRLQAHAAQFSPSLLQWMRAQGGQPRVLWSCQCIAVTLPQSVVPQLLARPDVGSVRPDAAFSRHRLLPPAVSRFQSGSPDWHLEAAEIREVWSGGYKGSGAVVAILDSGVDTSAAGLEANFREQGGWFDAFGQHATPHDMEGHGTQALALAVGGSVGGSPVGVAPQALWIAARVFDDAGNTDMSHVHLALQWALDPDGDPWTDDAPDVVTSSWGFSDHVNQCLLEFEQDIAALKAADIAVVFAAGNSGPGEATSISPGNNPGVFSVGAVDMDMNLAVDSSQGPSPCGADLVPTLVAPGVGVRTADLTAGGVFLSAEIWVDGTSAAAPQVAGYLALLKGAFPMASAAQLQQALSATAEDLGDDGPDNQTGHGMARVWAAYEYLCDLTQAPDCGGGPKPLEPGEDTQPTSDDDVTSEDDATSDDDTYFDDDSTWGDGGYDPWDSKPGAPDSGGSKDMATSPSTPPTSSDTLGGVDEASSDGTSTPTSGCSASASSSPSASPWWVLSLLLALATLRLRRQAT